MKNLVFLLSFLPSIIIAQTQEVKPLSVRHLPLTVSLNFNAISTPFKKLTNNFRNVGIKIGTEVSWNKRGNLLQSLNIGYYRNKLNGDGIYVNSEFIYRPELYKGMRVEFKLGPGISEVFLPTVPWVSDGKGNWKKAANTTPLTFQLHASTGLYYQEFKIQDVKISPFVQYEMVGVLNYGNSIPVLPTSFIHVGSRVKF